MMVWGVGVVMEEKSVVGIDVMVFGCEVVEVRDDSYFVWYGYWCVWEIRGVSEMGWWGLGLVGGMESVG